VWGSRSFGQSRSVVAFSDADDGQEADSHPDIPGAASSPERWSVEESPHGLGECAGPRPSFVFDDLH